MDVRLEKFFKFSFVYDINVIDIYKIDNNSNFDTIYKDMHIL